MFYFDEKPDPVDHKACALVGPGVNPGLERLAHLQCFVLGPRRDNFGVVLNKRCYERLMSWFVHVEVIMAGLNSKEDVLDTILGFVAYHLRKRLSHVLWCKRISGIWSVVFDVSEKVSGCFDVASTGAAMCCGTGGGVCGSGSRSAN